MLAQLQAKDAYFNQTAAKREFTAADISSSSESDAEDYLSDEFDRIDQFDRSEFGRYEEENENLRAENSRLLAKIKMLTVNQNGKTTNPDKSPGGWGDDGDRDDDAWSDDWYFFTLSIFKISRSNT